ncbi:hypothetical protein K3U93_17695 [Mycobacterium malmoense]|uniref:PE-PGRS family protein n=1 Tax=Mycobacterium malmoense TaxID=1780 RepID=A0ABX3SPE7_MYCMA|nr:hypothetical protein [Mycobacterium malmoense]ORA80659.1 hypothetical protein BST29_16090 [Mycobacterium malmoense]QZA16492.1 hypothetical protein K3U93_17695 [Mycobacterium malmoense]UNB93294.1 hypothetical protein H5T25_17680 [Mycobacterium malmoense]
MQQLTALRPLVTASAAALGASLIALTPTITNDIASDLQRGTANIEHHAVQLLSSGTVDPGVVNPIQTWMDLLQTANQSADVLYNQWLNLPAAPALQQVAANWTQYVSDYVGAYQNAANGSVEVFLGSGGLSWPTLTANMFTNLQSGNFIGAFNNISSALFSVQLSVLQPLEGILAIPGYALTNLAAGYSYLTGPGLTYFGEVALAGLPSATLAGMGQGFQNIYDAYAAGDWPAVFTNALNFPGLVTNYFLNGGAQGTEGAYGLLSNPTVTGDIGTVYGILDTILPTLTKDIVAPGAQPVSQGGSLAIGLPALVNQIFNGWPSPAYAVDSLINTIRTYAGVDLFNISDLTSAASVGGFAGLAPEAGLSGLSAGVLSAFDPAAVTNIAGSLGSSLAADVAGSLGSSLGANIAGSLATTLSVDLSTLALHILSAL